MSSIPPLPLSTPSTPPPISQHSKTRSINPTYTKIKLFKYLILHNICLSSREARTLVNEEKVYVHGCKCNSVSMKVCANLLFSGVVVLSSTDVANADTDVTTAVDVNANVNNAATTSTSSLIIFNKPCGIVTSFGVGRHENSKLNLSRFCSASNYDYKDDGKDDGFKRIPAGFNYVGRLDEHSRGLLLFSSSGRLTSRLISPDCQIPRVYKCIVQSDVLKSQAYSDQLINTIKEGVETSYGFFKGRVVNLESCEEGYVYAHKLCSCTDENEYESGRSDKFDYEKRKDRKWGLNEHHDDCDTTSSGVISKITIEVKEGKKRMVRRLLAHLDHFVLDLCRISYGDITLSDDADDGGETEVEPGKWRFATEKEEQFGRRLVNDWETGKGVYFVKKETGEENGEEFAQVEER